MVRRILGWNINLAIKDLKHLWQICDIYFFILTSQIDYQHFK